MTRIVAVFLTLLTSQIALLLISSGLIPTAMQAAADVIAFVADRCRARSCADESVKERAASEGAGKIDDIAEVIVAAEPLNGESGDRVALAIIQSDRFRRRRGCGAINMDWSVEKAGQPMPQP
jgi:hypothetical protein